MKLYQVLAAILAFKLLDVLYAFAFTELNGLELDGMLFVTIVWICLAAAIWYSFRWVAGVINRDQANG